MDTVDLALRARQCQGPEPGLYKLQSASFLTLVHNIDTGLGTAF